MNSSDNTETSHESILPCLEPSTHKSDIRFFVYARQEDTHHSGEHNKYNGMALIGSYDTEKEAVKWIEKYGEGVCQNCVKHMSCFDTKYFTVGSHVNDNIAHPVVLFIVKHRNGRPIKLSMEEISTKKYPTFVFGVSGFKMLMNEHYRYCVTYPIHNEVIPWWISYISYDMNYGLTTYVVGEEAQTVNRILEKLKIRATDDMYNRQLEKYQSFRENPDEYIKIRRNALRI